MKPKSQLGGAAAAEFDDLADAGQPTGQVESAPRQQSPQALMIARLNSDNMLRQFSTALGKMMTPERFVRIAGTQIQQNPELAQCDFKSLCVCLFNLAALGLEPGGPLAMAYLIPRKKKGVKLPNGDWDNNAKECTVIISYRGLMALARRSGEVLEIHVEAVRQNDEFKCTLGLSRELVHIPVWDDSPITHVYATALLKGGGHQFLVMTKTHIDRVKEENAQGWDKASSPWVTDWEAMAKKTVIRQFYKLLPVSTEMADSARAEDNSEDALNGEFTVVETEIKEIA